MLSGEKEDSLMTYSELSEIISKVANEFSEYYDVDSDTLYAKCMLAYEPYVVSMNQADYIPTNAMRFNLGDSELSEEDQQMISTIAAMYENGEKPEDIYDQLILYQEEPDLSEPMQGFVAIIIHEWTPESKGPFLSAFCDGVGYAIGAGACPGPIGAIAIGPLVAGSASLIAHHYWGHLIL